MDQISAQVVFGALMAYVLQSLKRASWFPILTEQSTKAWKIGLSAIIAAAAAFAINFQFDASHGILTISGLTWDHAWNGLVTFGVSFLSQHSSYELLVKKTVPLAK